MYILSAIGEIYIFFLYLKVLKKTVFPERSLLLKDINVDLGQDLEIIYLSHQLYNLKQIFVCVFDVEYLLNRPLPPHSLIPLVSAP